MSRMDVHHSGSELGLPGLMVRPTAITVKQALGAWQDTQLAIAVIGGLVRFLLSTSGHVWQSPSLHLSHSQSPTTGCKDTKDPPEFTIYRQSLVGERQFFMGK